MEENNTMQFVFWQNMISIHQSALIKALAREHGVLLAVQTDFEGERESSGWTVPDMGNARILISPDARTVEETLRAHPAAVHVFSGISTYPMVYAAFKQAVRRGLKTMVYAEPYRRQGWRGLLRSVKYRFLRLRYGKKIAALLATGRLGVECYRRAGFPASRIYFHGNNKTDRDIRDALEMGVGTFVADNREELDALERLAADAGRVQSILLRITPGIDPHTHKAISTGRVDSKFGSVIETGQALDITRYALGLPHIALRGFHCHIGSQIFDRYPFVDAARIMIDFMASVRTATGFVAHELNLGGGLGVPYTEYDRTVDYAAVIRDMGDEMRAICRERDFPLPHVILEPGRSLVAAAGITLYTVGSVKTIPGFRTYVSVDPVRALPIAVHRADCEPSRRGAIVAGNAGGTVL